MVLTRQKEKSTVRCSYQYIPESFLYKCTGCYLSLETLSLTEALLYWRRHTTLLKTMSCSKPCTEQATTFMKLSIVPSMESTDSHILRIVTFYGIVTFYTYLGTPLPMGILLRPDPFLLACGFEGMLNLVIIMYY